MPKTTYKKEVEVEEDVEEVEEDIEEVKSDISEEEKEKQPSKKAVKTTDKSIVKTPRIKAVQDGYIYIILPGVNSIFKSNTCYCNYILLDDNNGLNNIKQIKNELSKTYKAAGDLNIKITKCFETEKVYKSFINNYCQLIDDTKELKEQKKECEVNDDIIKILYHDNIFLTGKNITNFINNAAVDELAVNLKFEDFNKLFSIEMIQTKTKKVIKKTVKKTPIKPKKIDEVKKVSLDNDEDDESEEVEKEIVKPSRPIRGRSKKYSIDEDSEEDVEVIDEKPKKIISNYIRKSNIKKDLDDDNFDEINNKM